jgi:hypothetical protein
MAKGHNKRRNVGLMYEFLVRTISQALVEGDKGTSAKALKILKRHFRPGTELHRELRLVNALARTTVSSEATASSIIQEAKNAARSYDAKKLDREKSLLIRNVNHSLAGISVYDHHVNEYRTFATIQTLLNDWRSSGADLARVARFEDELLRKLVTEQESVETTTGPLTEESPGTARLLARIMTQRLTEKYSSVLSDDQKRLIKAYAFSTVNDDRDIIRKRLSEIKENLLASVQSYIAANPEDSYLNGRLSETKDRLLSESLDSINDDTVTRFMLYVKLNEELLTGNGDDHE